MCLGIVGKIDGQNIIPDIPDMLRVINRKQHLHAPVDIAWHQIRTAEVNLLLAAILKVIDAAVFQKTAYHTDDADVIT